MTLIDAVPVLTVEATIADLVDVGGDLSLAGESLADARHHDRITNPDRLRDLLTRSAVARGYATVDVLLDVLAPVQHATPAGMTPVSGGYDSWRAVERALKAVAVARANATGTDANRHLRAAYLDRVLCRVFSSSESSEWMLKGGTSMLARVPLTRTTKDLDLWAPKATSIPPKRH